MLPNEKIADVQASTSMQNPADSLSTDSRDLEISRSNEILSSSLYSTISESGFLHENKELWDANSGMRAPVEDTVICAARHHMRMDRFCLDEPPAEMAKDLNSLQCSNSCPTLLLNENDESSTLIRYSLYPDSINSIVIKGEELGFFSAFWLQCLHVWSFR